MNERIKKIRIELGLSQEEFGRRLGVTRGAVTNIELNKVEPKPLFIDLICREFNVDENWLRTGEGEMFRQQSRDEEMAALMGQLLADRPESFRRQLISVLLRFDPNGPEWQVLENIYDALKKEAQD